MKIVYRPGCENMNADALSRHSQLPAPTVGIAEDEVQVFPITAEEGRDEVTPTQLSQEVAEVGLQAAKTLTTDGDQEGIWRKLPLVAEDQSNPANCAITA